MSDIPSTGPDSSAVSQQNKTPSHYEQKVGPEYGNPSIEVGGVILNVKDKNITIINNPEKYSQLQETKQQTEALSEDFKQEFIEKLRKLPDFEGSKVQEAIEKQTIEIKKIPDRNGYAIYESKVGNLVYITRLDGTQYENIDKFRNKELFSAMIIGGFVRQGYKIEQNQKLWRLYNKDGIEIPLYSDEYSTASLNSVNYMRGVIKSFQEEYKRRQKKKIK